METQNKRKRKKSPGRIHKLALVNQKTQQIGTENFEITENADISPHKDLIKRELLNHSVLSGLSEIEIKELSSKFFLCTGKEGEYLFKQNDPFAEHFFIVLEGELDVEINTVSVRTYEDQGSFGELALMYNAPRSASVKYKSDCKMLALSSVSFKKVLQKIKIQSYEENKKYISEAEFLKGLGNLDHQKLASEAMNLYYKPGRTMFLNYEFLCFLFIFLYI
jgi:hypothetical protein